jgi:hypothetical protein
LKKIFYHIHRLADRRGCANKYSKQWIVGNKFLFEDETFFRSNLLFDRIFHLHVDRNIQQDLFYDMFLEIANSTNKNKGVLIKKLSKNCTSSNHLQFIREIFFEGIRIHIDKSLPSRLTGIWLTDYDNLESWNDYFTKEQLPYKVFEVTHFGRSHFADSRWITDISLDFTHLTEAAISYWTGKLKDNKGKPIFELLCNGTIEVIKEHIV